VPRVRGQRISAVASVVVITIGLAVLAGWAVGLEGVKSLFLPGAIVMIPNTALMFLSAAIGLWLTRPTGPVPTKTRRIVIRAIGALVFTIGFLTFVERVFGYSFGIDLLLFGEAIKAYPYLPPGQMATNSTLGFILAGLALLTANWETQSGLAPTQWFSLVGVSIAALADLGYLFGARPLYAIDIAAQMSPATALSFTFLHTGLLFARPDRGWVALITSEDLGGVAARRLLVPTIVVPIILCWTWVQGLGAQLYVPEEGIALLALTSIAVFAMLVIQSASVLRATDREREQLLLRERSAREEAQRAEKIAEDANRAKGVFLATMSHELRTPLNAIIGYSSLLSDGIAGPVPDSQSQFVDRIGISARHLLALIDDILSLSRIEAGKEHVSATEVDALSVAREAASIIEPLARSKQLTFTVTLPEKPVVIETDPGKLRQILLNLLSNAVKFTDAGAVTLAVHLDTDDRAKDIVFNVDDSGVGISADHLERIFDPFWQVDQSATRRHPGTGLGLSVSRRLSLLLGGRLTVASSLGQGSCFELRLPLDGIPAANVS
jgi:signal transduction histidine kinase